MQKDSLAQINADLCDRRPARHIHHIMVQKPPPILPMILSNRHRISSVTFWPDFCLAQFETTSKPLPDSVKAEKRLNDNDNSDNNIIIKYYEKCTNFTKNLTKRYIQTELFVLASKQHKTDQQFCNLWWPKDNKKYNISKIEFIKAWKTFVVNWFKYNFLHKNNRAYEQLFL